MDGAAILKNYSEKFCTINQNQNKYISLPHEKNTVIECFYESLFT